AARISFMSSPRSALRARSTAASSFALRSGEILSDHSFAFFSTSYVMLSRRLRVSISSRRLDADLLFLAGRLVLGRHVQDSVRIDVEGDFDLRHAARGGWNSGELEFSDRPVVARHVALALQHVDLDRRLIVVGRRERLALLGRDGRVARDEHRGHAAERLDTE